MTPENLKLANRLSGRISACERALEELENHTHALGATTLLNALSDEAFKAHMNLVRNDQKELLEQTLGMLKEQLEEL